MNAPEPATGPPEGINFRDLAKLLGMADLGRNGGGSIIGDPPMFAVLQIANYDSSRGSELVTVHAVRIVHHEDGTVRVVLAADTDHLQFYDGTGLR